MRLLLAALLLAGADDPAKPNLVLILCDDLGQGDLGCYNPDSKIPTPAMDRLAAEGLRFTDMHSPSSVCTPTRYGLLTGRYCWRTPLKKGVLWGFSPALIEEGRPTLASMLKARGYRTAVVGKWHLGLGRQEKTDYFKRLDAGPLSAGFEAFRGIPASLDMEPYVWVVDDRAEAPPTETVAASKHRRQGGAGFWRGGPIAPGFRHADVLPRIEREALEFLDGQSEDRPFFLYLPLTSPHTPWVPSPDFEGKSKVGHYGDFTMQTDRVVGSVLEALDRRGLAKNTIVVLASDNGSNWPPEDVEKWGHRSNDRWRGQKADIHEGGHRVPFLVRWPGVAKAGATTGRTSCLTDVFATMADVVGAAEPAEDGASFKAVLEGRPETAERAPVIHHSGSGMFAIRAGPWKLIEGQGSGGFTRIPPRPDDPPGQLYNLADDPGETRNLYRERPEDVARLARLLEAIRSR